jgi:hypothetical protein
VNPLAANIDWRLAADWLIHGPGAFLDAATLLQIEQDKARLAREIEDWKIQQAVPK